MVIPLWVVTPAAAQKVSDTHAVGIQFVAEGLTAPVAMAYPDDGSGRLFVVDQAGTIRLIDAHGQLLPEPFLDLSSLIVPLNAGYDERGTLGMAFHPDYAKNGRMFVYYTAPLREGGQRGWDHTNVLAEFSVSKNNPDQGDLASQKIVMQIDQPSYNHNAGHITFGPDGYLYIPIGDGGGSNDLDKGHTPTLGNGQDLRNLQGSILRIDVNGASGTYTVPADNPFVGQGKDAPEIYAYGFRNPYHIAFDTGGTHALIVGDAGQDLFEEVDVVTKGGNYGWRIKEATHCFNAREATQPYDSCKSTGADGKPLIDPVIEYSHTDLGVVVIGGYVYRGAALADLAGQYIFGDYNRMGGTSPNGSLLWATPSENAGMWKWGEIKVVGGLNDRLDGYLLAIGQGPDGELYVMTSQSFAPSGKTGKVWKLVPA